MSKPRSRTTRSPLRTHKKNSQVQPGSNDVIVLSSDDEARPTGSKKRSSPSSSKLVVKRARAKTKAPRPPSPDIVEISSDEEPDPSTPIGALKLQIIKLQAENKRLQELASVGKRSLFNQLQEEHRSKNDTQRAERAELAKKELLSALEDHLTCEICTVKMWCPSTLQCGHTFCQSCLEDWFSTTLAQYVTQNPHYNASPPAFHRYLAALRNPTLSAQIRQEITIQLRNLYETLPHPSYTCPTCRLGVKTRPIEVYSIKNLVKTAADAAGEAAPRTNGTTSRRSEDTWNRFFPKFLS